MASRPLFAAPRTRAPASSSSRAAGVVMEVGFLVTRLARQEVRRSRPAGLSLQRFRAVAAVAAKSAATPTELARHLGLAPATVTKMVDHLVGLGLLRRGRGGADGRRRTLRVTRKGRTRLEATFAVFRSLIGERLSPLTPGQRARVTAAAELLQPLLLEE